MSGCPALNDDQLLRKVKKNRETKAWKRASIRVACLARPVEKPVPCRTTSSSNLRFIQCIEQVLFGVVKFGIMSICHKLKVQFVKTVNVYKPKPELERFLNQIFHFKKIAIFYKAFVFNEIQNKTCKIGPILKYWCGAYKIFTSSLFMNLRICRLWSWNKDKNIITLNDL